MSNLITCTSTFTDTVDVTHIVSVKKSLAVSGSPILHYIEIITDNNKMFRPAYAVEATRDTRFNTLLTLMQTAGSTITDLS